MLKDLLFAFCFLWSFHRFVESASNFQGTVNLGKSSAGISIANSAKNTTESGKVVANLGDYNGDGYSDVAIFSGGYFYVVFGAYSPLSRSLENLTPTTGFSITGDILTEWCSIEDEVCYSNVAALGDINGDGLADFIIVVAVPTDASVEPVYYIIYGTKNPSSINLNSWSSTGGIIISSSGVVESTPFEATSVKGNDLLSVLPSQKKKTSKTRRRSTFDRLLRNNQTHHQEEDHEKLTFPSQFEENNEITEAQRIHEEASVNYYFNPCDYPTNYVYEYETVSYTSTISFMQDVFPLGPIGDVNGDGINDIMIVGSLLASQKNFTFYVYYGSTSLPTSFGYDSFTFSQGFTLTGDAQSFPRQIYSYTDYLDQNITCIYNETSGEATRVYTYLGYNSSEIDVGIAFNSAGDMNNDGFDDLIIGSGYGYGNAGITFIVYGANKVYNSSIVLSQLTTQQGYKIIGSGQISSTFYYGDSSGLSVGGGGMDFNNDGYDDVIIGAPLTNGYFGAAYVIYGTSAHRKSIFLSQLTPSVGIGIFTFQLAIFGFSVSTAGDFNNDGYDDVVIGAVSAAGGGGIVYVIFGGKSLVNIHVDSSFTASQGVQIIGIKNKPNTDYYSSTGTSVSGGGDFNHDGIADVILGAPGQNFGNQTNSGSGFVIFGTSETVASLPLKYLSAVVTYQTGRSPLAVSVPGDINGDGYMDILMGAFVVRQSYLVFGSSEGFPSIANLTTESDVIQGNLNSWFGYSVSGCDGDFNGDGITDFVIGAPGKSSYWYYEPESLVYNAPYAYEVDSYAYIVFGASNLDSASGDTIELNSFNVSNQGLTIIAGEEASMTGFSVAGVGNVNQNALKLASVVVGAPLAASSNGKAYVIFGSNQPFTQNSITLTDSSSEEEQVQSQDTTTTSSSTPFISFTGVGYRDYLGWAVGSAGDFNGDGIPDFLMSAPGYSYQASAGATPSPYVGIVYMIFGSPNLANSMNNFDLNNLNYTKGLQVIGSVPYSSIGISVSGIGDINGDGYADFIIGAPYAKNGDGGAYVVYGKPTSSSSSSTATLKTSQYFTSTLTSSHQGFVITTSDTEGFVGFSVSGAGDINHDGFPDFMIGCPGLNENAGVAYIIYGGKTLTDIDLSALTSVQGVTVVNDILFSQVSYSLASYSDSKGNIMALFGSNPGYDEKALGTCYNVVPASPPEDSTIVPTARPTFAPSYVPSRLPTAIPSHIPTVIPSLAPTFAPTVAPFWVTNAPLILGVVIPTVLSFIPIYFSKQICFYVLNNWSSSNRRRGVVQITIYGGCKKVFLKDFVEAMETKDKKKELDEKESLTSGSRNTMGASHGLELHVLKSSFSTGMDDSSHVNNPLFVAEEGMSGKALLGSPSPANSPQFTRSKTLSAVAPARDPLSPEGADQVADHPRTNSFRQSSFRQSNVDIDSDDEHEGEATELEEGLHNNNKNNNNNNQKNSKNDMLIKSVYSIQFDNPEIDALYNGKLLLIDDRSANKDLLKALETSFNFMNNKEEVTVIRVQEIPTTSKPEVPSMKSSMNGVVNNFMEEWPVIRYAVIAFFFPLSEGLQWFFGGSSPLSVAFSFLNSIFLFILERKVVIISIYGLTEMMNFGFVNFMRRSSLSRPSSAISSSSSSSSGSLRVSLFKFLFFGIRLFAIDSLYEIRKAWITDTPSSPSLIGDFAVCSGLVGIYTLQVVGSCLLSQDCSPSTLLLNSQNSRGFAVSAISRGSECIYLFQSSAQSERQRHAVMNNSPSSPLAPSRLDSFLPLTINAVFLISILIKPENRQRTSVLGLLSSMVFVDYSTKLCLTCVPEQWKRFMVDDWWERSVEWFWEATDIGMERMIEADSILRTPF
jgi:hypothetical protein